MFAPVGESTAWLVRGRHSGEEIQRVRYQGVPDHELALVILRTAPQAEVELNVDTIVDSESAGGWYAFLFAVTEAEAAGTLPSVDAQLDDRSTSPTIVSPEPREDDFAC